MRKLSADKDSGGGLSLATECKSAREFLQGFSAGSAHGKKIVHILRKMVPFVKPEILFDPEQQEAMSGLIQEIVVDYATATRTSYSQKLSGQAGSLEGMAGMAASAAIFRLIETINSRG